MVDFKAMADKAKQIFQQRGGAQAAKGDAEELRDVARGPGSDADKAKAAAEAIREPGAPQAGASGTPSPGAGDPQSPN